MDDTVPSGATTTPAHHERGDPKRNATSPASGEDT